MGSVELWGISFRSVSHMHWFILSTGLLVGHVIIQLAVRFLRPGDGPFNPTPVLSLHGIVIISAVIKTHFGTVNGPAYSVDCIWFNALMTLIHLLIWRLSLRTPRS
jgi:hypothetical protein